MGKIREEAPNVPALGQALGDQKWVAASGNEDQSLAVAAVTNCLVSDSGGRQTREDPNDLAQSQA